MKDRQRGRLIALFLACLLLMALPLSLAFAESADPIRVSSLSEPQSVISEQDVSITIKIYNSSTKDMEDPITLFNSEGISVEKYSSLGAEQSVTYTGTWHITSDQIAKGRINYFIKYTVDGNETTRTIPITIQTEAAAPQMIANYTISPASARQGQKMHVAYTLANTGNIELRDITIENPGISSNVLTQASLSVGERVVLEDEFAMADKEMVSEPVIKYRSADSSQYITVTDINKRTLTPAEEGLEITLEADHTDNIYPGETVELTAKLRNTGDSSYVGLSITLSDGSQIDSGIELAPGVSYETTTSYAPTSTGDIVATVSGIDAEGDSISLSSAPVSFTTQDASMALVLDVQAAAETDVIYTEPAVVRFAIRVSNIGETDATTLTITEAGTTVATIASLPAGSSRTIVVDLETSIAGQIQFEVAGKDAAGNDKSYKSNILTIRYMAPTPEPTNTPAPTEVPPTPTPVPTPEPEPTMMETITNFFTPLQLRIAAGVLAGAIVIILIANGISSSRRKRRLDGALDTMEISSDVRDSFGKRKKRKGAKKNTTENKRPPIVSTSELTEEDVHPAQTPAPQTDTPRQEEQQKSEGNEATVSRRRSHNTEFPVTNEPTLRVQPADQRPEFPQIREADNSKTRVFAKRVEQTEQENLSDTKRLDIAAPLSQLSESTADKDSSQQSRMRLDEEIKRGTPVIETKKKQKGSLFGRKKNEEPEDEEDFFD